MLTWRTVVFLALSFLLAMIGDSLGKSQRAPSDTPPVQAPSSQPAQPTATSQRGTDQDPLTVKILPGPDSKEQAEKQEHERAEKAETDKKLADQTERLADDTGRLAIITVFLFFTALGQVILFLWQLNLIRESLSVSKRAANAAMKSAIVAESALSGTEAPFLFAIVNFPIITIPETGAQIPGEAHYILRNFGRSPAIVREIYDSCIASTEVPDPVPFPPLQSPILKVEIIAAGEPGEAHQLNEIKSLRENDNSEPIFVVGQARYADVFGNQYLTGFCYVLNERASAFYAIGGSSHNYRRKLSDDEAREAEERDTLPPIKNSGK